MEFSEILKMSLVSIRTNKLRSALTLLGIVIGVFSIIGVMTAVQVLQNSIESGLSNLGTNTFQIQKQPVIANRPQYLKSLKWKDLTYEQAKAVKGRITLARYVGIGTYYGQSTVQFEGHKTNPDVDVGGEEPEGLHTNNWAVREGRNISDDDVKYAAMVIILMDDVVKKLFPYGGAVGSVVKVGSQRYTVIGTYEHKGSSIGGNDNKVILPLTTFLEQYGKDRSVYLKVQAKSAEVYDDCVEETRMILRTLRKVGPGEEDNFSVYSNDSLISTFNEFTVYVKMGVGFMSFIALIAAGIGIMNIMLVSVTERTREIGIRKALGARKSNILAQFVSEAVILCQFGGIIGVGLGILGGNLAAFALEFPAVFPVDWALIGLAITSFVGVVFGVYPAWKAANLDPIESLRYE
ncbi:MAG: FtsX-like permease family protein [Ignavibacteriae bacterium]|nr:MAG: FtsX-like permease family protein [Ignavibacteriota bacterium]